MTDLFSEDEMERLNKVLPIEINPYLDSGSNRVALPLGAKTREWLFETTINLPSDTRKELNRIGFDALPEDVKVHVLNEVLEDHQWSSAPKWWELNFFDARFGDLWGFFVEQCRNNYSDSETRETFDFYVHSLERFYEARSVLRLHSYNPDQYSEAEVEAAFTVVDAAYPMDFRDYDEAPRKVRAPLDSIQSLIGHELDQLDSVFSKRWFEFKILDELAAFKSYQLDGERDSELSKKIAKQLRHYMFGKVLSLGRMIEHYRWKFSHEQNALRGIRAELAGQERGMKGGKASERSKLEALMTEIEALADLFPRISERAIFEQAYQNANEKQRMPKSQKSIENYGVFIRSEEPFKSRYEAIFRKNP